MNTLKRRATHRVMTITGICLWVLGVTWAVTPIARAGEEVEIDGVLHVRNPASPPGGMQKMQLEEIWRVDENSDLLLGLPTRVAVDKQRRVYILDAQLNQVHVFSIDGEFLRTLSREGDGPGEMRNPSDMVVHDDGSIGIVQEYPGRVIRLDSSGNPLPSLYPGGAPEEGGWCVLMSGCARGNQLVVCGNMQRQGAGGERIQRQFLSAFGEDGVERAAFVEIEETRGGDRGGMRERDLIRPFMMAYDIGPDGRLFVAEDWESYAINVYKPDGLLDRVIEREYEPWRRTEEDRQRLIKLVGAGGEGAPPFELDEFAPTVAAFQGGVQVLDNGEVWIHSSRGNRNLPDGVLAVHDVFDPKGHFLRQVEVHCPGDSWNDRLLFVSGDRVIRVRRFVDAFVTSLGPGSLPEDQATEDEAPAVICYRVL